MIEINKDEVRRAILLASHKNTIKNACQELYQKTGIKSYIWYNLANGSFSKRYFLTMIAYLEYFGGLNIRQMMRLEEIQYLYTKEDNIAVVTHDNRYNSKTVYHVPKSQLHQK